MIDELNKDELRKLKFHPQNNPDVITIMKRPDGNYRGFMMKNGKLVQVRQGDPQTVLSLLLTTDVPMTPDENTAPEAETTVEEETTTEEAPATEETAE